MTTKTEQSRREMYEALGIVKGRVEINYSVKDMLRGVDKFEHTLEDYLEELRKDLDFACKLADLTDARLRKTLQERDDLRNRLQAFEFANKAAGEELRKSQETIKRQREYISEMWGTSKASESDGSTSAQYSTGNSPETICGAFPTVCQHSFRNEYAYPSGKLQSRCIFCTMVREG